MPSLGKIWRWGKISAVWLSEELSFHRERFVLFLPVFFGLGIIGYFTLKSEPPWQIAAAATVAFWLLAIVLRRYSLVMRILVVLAMAASGFTISQWRTIRLQAVVVQESFGPLALSGRIAAIDHRANSQRFILTHVTAPDDQTVKLPPVLRITTRGGLERDTGVGDWVQFRAVLTPLRPPSVVGGFDYQFYGYFYGLTYGIGGGGFMVSSLRYIAPPADYRPGFWQGFFARIDSYRWRMSYWLIQEIEGDAGAMAAALVDGDQGQIAAPILQSMRDSGLAHILSISGLHISLAAIIVILAVRGGLALIPYCALYWPLKQIAGSAGLVAAIGYGLLAGINQVPVLRSLVMLGVMLLAMILGRRALSLLTLAWAAMISLLVAPEQLLGPSFQLSFAAVLVLVTISEAYQLSLADGFDSGLVRRLRLWLVVSLVSSVAVTVATTPTSAYIFHRTAIYGVFANLLAVPLSDFIIMPLVVGELLLYPFGWDGWLHRPLGWSIDGLIALSRFFADLPQAVITNRAFSGGAFALMLAGGLWLCLWRGSLRWVGIGVAAVGLVLAMVTPPPRLIIGGDGKNFAYLRADGAMVLARGRITPLTADNWAVTLGVSGGVAAGALRDWDSLPEVAARNLGGLVGCDLSLCRSDELPKPILWVRTAEAIATACQLRGVIIISALTIDGECRDSNLVFDRDYLQNSGAVSLWFDRDAPSGIALKTVNGERGNRPWMVQKPTRSTSNIEVESSE